MKASRLDVFVTNHTTDLFVLFLYAAFLLVGYYGGAYVLLGGMAVEIALWAVCLVALVLWIDGVIYARN